MISQRWADKSTAGAPCTVCVDCVHICIVYLTYSLDLELDNGSEII